eukprot:Seg2911.2 transcript_id=Seg2911.2/GoldUCD/mRNA.D3Y31 product="hypothetical protein" protein_id=Seg2911.2/GoldUCD/D3Y31
MQDNLVACEDNVEHLENMSRRNNMKLIGIPENASETWDESEEIFKSQRRQSFTRRGGSRVKTNPRSIVAKFEVWKHKEKVTNAAEKIRPDGVKFLDDFSKRTLDKRFAQQPELLDARKKGNIAKPPENRTHSERQSTDEHISDDEVSFDHDL